MRKIWDDFKHLNERYYTPDRVLKVTFSGEPAVDSGGPKREFFFLQVLFCFLLQVKTITYWYVFSSGVYLLRAQGLG